MRLVSSAYYKEDSRELNEEPQFDYLSNCIDDFHEEDEKDEERSQKTMPEIVIPDCKHADLEERLVGLTSNLERKDRELDLLREYLNLTIKDLQADIHEWRTKYIHAKSILHLNGIPFFNP
ncbi:hypothetical protein TorRG33x02_251280 [Trema orientale]|uniref:Uncharacterized protein n=1 Tax=Trema orientale TaxID=63057 RepID=A0A2P5DHJ3_TREOI|nr:hypothetical protein TorRG33x02_251280 [Trema orientale]